MENMSNDALIFYGISALFIGFIIIGIARENSRDRYAKPMQTKPQPLQRDMPDVAGNFDGASFQAARAMAGEMERYPDPVSKTLALAEMIHRQKAYEQRQTDRQFAQERKETDALDRVLGIVDRLSGRQVPEPRRPYPPEYQDRRGYPEYQDRINGYHHYREIPDDMNIRQGFWK